MKTPTPSDAQQGAQAILRMIETVAPADTAKLDEIDARAWFFLEEAEPTERFVIGEATENRLYIRGAVKNGFWHEGACPKYTRSRDSLKAIRPEGWIVTAYEDYQPVGWRFQLQKAYSSTKSKTLEYTSRYWEGPTEELAELHAIIQAIEYERRRGRLSLSRWLSP